MTFRYKFWSRVLHPFDWFLRQFGYYIIFRYSEDQKDVFDRFTAFGLCHHQN